MFRQQKKKKGREWTSGGRAFDGRAEEGAGALPETEKVQTAAGLTLGSTPSWGVSSAVSPSAPPVRDGYRTAAAPGWKTRTWSLTRMRRIRPPFLQRLQATEYCWLWENTGFICTTVVLQWSQWGLISMLLISIQLNNLNKSAVSDTFLHISKVTIKVQMSSCLLFCPLVFFYAWDLFSSRNDAIF